MAAELPQRDRPWLMRTYAGFSSAQESNALYRLNLSRGQTGLSVAFDLPTQTGLDPDDPRAAGEVGKVGVSVAHLGDLDQLFDGLPLDRMNTSMTINATAMWLLALYAALAERRGVALAELRGTTQNDIVKEYLSRGLYVFPPGPSMRLTVDTIAYAVREMPRFNPINVCSYHLQEAGATPTQELAFALSTAVGVLDAVRDSGQLPADELPAVVGRLSFFVNAGMRFVEEACKMRAFTSMWDEIARERYGVEDPKLRRFRYGVQVNSLGLTEQQPENNVQRIVVQALGVLLSRDARARAIQLPAWNEALGLPRPWDQQWSLRMQQVLAYETDLLELGDVLDGSPVIADKVRELTAAARAEIDRVASLGGVVAATESGYLKRQLVTSQTARMRAIERGDQVVVGVNRFEGTADSPLTGGVDGGIQRVDPAIGHELAGRVADHRASRDGASARAALGALARAAAGEGNLMPASIRCAHAGVTTGEWADTLRGVFGEYRAPAGIDIGPSPAGDGDREAAVRARLTRTVDELGHVPRLLVAKPGLEGHTNGAEQIAIKARDLGFEVILGGVRQSADEIVITARDEDVDLIGLSLLSGSHMELTAAVLQRLEAGDLADIPLVVGGIIPAADAQALRDRGVRGVFTPRDSDLNGIMAALIDVIRGAHGLAPLG
jgi:ethylmalonyl-CoA mutase